MIKFKQNRFIDMMKKGKKEKQKQSHVIGYQESSVSGDLPSQFHQNKD